MDPALLDLLTKGGAFGVVIVVGWLVIRGTFVLSREIRYRDSVIEERDKRIAKLEDDREKYLNTMHRLLGVSERIAAAVKQRDDDI